MPGHTHLVQVNCVSVFIFLNTSCGPFTIKACFFLLMTSFSLLSPSHSLSLPLPPSSPAEVPSSLHSTPSRYHGDRQLGADALRLRAGLFCVFPYLDVCSLLRAAEVCSDWRFVARHPAVWTRLRLENARVSAEVGEPSSSVSQSLNLKEN